LIFQDLAFLNISEVLIFFSAFTPVLIADSF